MMATCRDCCNYQRTNTHWCKYYGGIIAEMVVDEPEAEKQCKGYNWTTEVKGER